MTKSKIKLGIIPKKQLEIKFKNLKILSRWLLNYSQNINIKSIINDKKFELNYKYKLFTYILHCPKIVHYCNTYLNSKYEFSKYTPSEWLLTFKQIIKISNLKSLNFSKYQNPKRNNFTTLINKYYQEVYKISLNQNEINHLFLLYETGHITDLLLKNIEQLVSHKETKNKQLQTKKEILKTFKESSITTTKIEKTECIKNFITNIQNYIRQRKLCIECNLFNNGNIILDTNIKEPQNIDIAVIYENPTNEDIKQDKLLSSKINLLFHKFFNQLVEKYNLKYIITTSLLCHSKQKNINLKKSIDNCKGITNEIHKNFPANLNIYIGNNTIKYDLNLKGGLTKLNGELIDNNFLIYSPDEVVTSTTKLKKFETAFNKLDEILKKSVHQKSNIDFEKINVNKVLKNQQNLTLFDIKIIKEKIIFILIDENGHKTCIFEDFKYPIYIKYGKYKNCDYISEKYDAICYLNKEEKSYIQQLLNKNLKQLLKIS